MGVKDIGRKSFSSTLTATDLGMGITSASFHKSGAILSCIDALKISATGEENSIAKSFNLKSNWVSCQDHAEALPRLRLESFV